MQLTVCQRISYEKTRNDASTVALVSQRYPPAVGGIELHVEMLARGLVKRGIRVEIIHNRPYRATAEGRATKRRCGAAISDCRQRLGFLCCTRPRQVALAQCVPLFDTSRPLYHTPIALQAAFASRLSGVPIVLTPHYHGTGHSPFRRVLHVPYRTAGKWLLSRASLVICMSETERQLLYHHFGRNFTTKVVPNGVNLEEIRAARPRDRPRVGS